jgi:peptide/nickel transport system permease protein
MRRLQNFFANRQTILGSIIVGMFIIIAVLAPAIAPPAGDEDPTSMYKVVGTPFDKTPHPPSDEAILGTLPGQLDIFYTLVWGTRHALRFGLIVALSTGVLGILIGAISGYVGGITNGLLMRITNGFLAIPVIIGVGLFRQLGLLSDLPITAPGVKAFLALLGEDYVMLGLIFFSWMPYARILNANAAKLRISEFVVAARTLGASQTRVLILHLLPNTITPAIVLVARDIGAMVILGAAFVFIGIGGNSPWGELATLGRGYVIGTYGNPLQTWWTWLPVTLALIFFGVGWNLLGDGLNDVLNPYR